MMRISHILIYHHRALGLNDDADDDDNNNDFTG